MTSSTAELRTALAGMNEDIRACVSLRDALARAARNERTPVLFGFLSAAVRAGHSFGDAVSAHPAYLPRWIGAHIDAGERSGTLDDALATIVERLAAEPPDGELDLALARAATAFSLWQWLCELHDFIDEGCSPRDAFDALSMVGPTALRAGTAALCRYLAAGADVRAALAATATVFPPWLAESLMPAGAPLTSKQLIASIDRWRFPSGPGGLCVVTVMQMQHAS